MGLKQRVYLYTLELLKKQQVKIIAIGGALAIFGIFTISFTMFMWSSISYQYVNEPVSIRQFNGISVDSKGNIYIGDRENDLVQVFNEKGEFLYGFYAGTSQWQAFDIDSQDKLHIVGARAQKHEVFYGGELVSSIEISIEQLIELEKSYRSSRSKVYKTENKIYKYSFLNKIVVRDLLKNEKNIIRLPVPLWPWSFIVYAIFYASGVALILSGTMGIYRLEEKIKDW